MKTEITQLDTWDWFQIAEGIAKLIKQWNRLYKETKELDTIHEWVKEKRRRALEILDIVCAHHDRILRTKDPCNDCEPIRYYPAIAEAFEEYYESNEE